MVITTDKLYFFSSKALILCVLKKTVVGLELCKVFTSYLQQGQKNPNGTNDLLLSST